MSTQKLRVVLATSLLTLSTGCGGDSATKPTAMVTGTVTLNGEPFTGASIHFYNPEVGGGAFDLNGNGFFESPEPIVVGEYMVSLDRPRPSVEDRSQDIPAMYRSSSKSGLVARISRGTDNHFSFDIKGKPPKRKENDAPVPFDTLPGGAS